MQQSEKNKINRRQELSLSLFFLAITFLLSVLRFNQAHLSQTQGGDFYQKYVEQEFWVDSLYKTLSLDQKLGQLFMVAAYSNKDQAHTDYLENLVKNHHLGGLIFMQGGPVRQAILTNYLQSKAKIPLLISIDGEWGVSMRLDSTLVFPRQLTLGAIQDVQLVYDFGAEVARQCRLLGIHMNLAPVVDVNSNPLNPVIGDRSFGEDKLNVSVKGTAYMQGMQQNGVLACAKHFPGHGDTDKDSHKTLPTVAHPFHRLNDVELFPFKALIQNGVAGIMSAHLYVPSLDSTPGLATSLSYPAITHLLKEEMGYTGLIFTDALNMKGVADYFPPGEVDLRAFLAGNDVLLFAEDVPRAIRLLKEAYQKKTFSEERLGLSVKKILRAKHQVGLKDYQPLETKNLIKELNRPEALVLKHRLYEAALTLLIEKDTVVPVQNLDSISIASLSIGSIEKTIFQERLGHYAPVKHYNMSNQTTDFHVQKLLEELAGYDLVLAGFHSMNRSAGKNYGVSVQAASLLAKLAEKTTVVVTVFGSPYSLKFFQDIPTVLAAYEANEMTQSLAAQAIFGGVAARGRLPVGAGERFRVNDGMSMEDPFRLRFSLPEEAGLSSWAFLKVDSIIENAIRQEAMPGCQVVVVRHGQVVYHKAYGWHTYEKKKPVLPTDLYDLASITKVAGATLGLMNLWEEEKIDLQKQVQDYLPESRNTVAGKLFLNDILTHTSGLQAWIPFYTRTTVDSIYDTYYCDEMMGCFTVKVAENLFIRDDYPDTLWKLIYNSELKHKNEYKYSDLGFYMFRRLMERVSSQRLDSFLAQRFYAPLGLRTLGYNPYAHFPLEQIVPTEMDAAFRKQLIHGYVHDPGAAMLGGISGHAGLFGDALDVAILMQMLLNKGSYGGKRYLQPETLELFTSRQSKNNRRGLGFDKPEPDKSKINPAAKSASLKTFGHTGFTGTCVWADPEQDLIYVFLSNRIYPQAANKKLIDMNIRTNVQEAIYSAIISKDKKS